MSDEDAMQKIIMNKHPDTSKEGNSEQKYLYNYFILI